MTSHDACHNPTPHYVPHMISSHDAMLAIIMSRCGESAGAGAGPGKGKWQMRAILNLILRRSDDPGVWSLRPESVLSRVAYELLWRVLGSGLRPPAAE